MFGFAGLACTDRRTIRGLVVTVEGLATDGACFRTTTTRTTFGVGAGSGGGAVALPVPDIPPTSPIVAATLAPSARMREASAGRVARARGVASVVVFMLFVVAVVVVLVVVVV